MLLALTVAAPPAAAQAVDGPFLVVTPIALSVGVLRWPSLRGWWRAVTRRQVSG